MLTLKLAFGVGVLAASPVVIYHVWAFLAPALYPREKRLIVPALSVGVVLFVAGAAVGYLFALPAALRVLFGFQRADLTAMITIDKYFGVAVPLILAFGWSPAAPGHNPRVAGPSRAVPGGTGCALVVTAFGAALLAPDAVSMLMMVPWYCSTNRHRGGWWPRARRAPAARGRGARAAARGGARGAAAQQPRRRPARGGGAGHLARGRRRGRPPARSAPEAVDTAARLGLPTRPSRSFPPTDPWTRCCAWTGTSPRYLADTLAARATASDRAAGPRVHRREDAAQADSVRYEGACRWTPWSRSCSTRHRSWWRSRCALTRAGAAAS
jgi:hypothetical protein